jgi:hypothetical protein
VDSASVLKTDPLPDRRGSTFLMLLSYVEHMRDEEEIREQYEFLKQQLDDENMNHQGVRQMFTYYKRALGWALEEEYI